MKIPFKAASQRKYKLSFVFYVNLSLKSRTFVTRLARSRLNGKSFALCDAIKILKWNSFIDDSFFSSCRSRSSWKRGLRKGINFFYLPGETALNCGEEADEKIIHHKKSQIISDAFNRQQGSSAGNFIKHPVSRLPTRDCKFISIALSIRLNYLQKWDTFAI